MKVAYLENRSTTTRMDPYSPTLGSPLQGLSLARSALNKVPVAKVIRSEQLDSKITRLNSPLTRSDSFLAKAVGGSFLTPAENDVLNYNPLDGDGC